MEKIAKKTQLVFGGNLAAANNIAQFGSLKAGSPAYSLDPDTIQSLSAYINGWAAAVVNNNAPVLQDVNALDFLFSRQLAYLMQAGLAEWDATTPYYIGSMVNDGLGNIFISKTDNNVNHAITDTTYWRSTKPYLTSTSLTANTNDEIMVDTSGAVKTITLPASPSAGDKVTIMDAKKTFATNNCTVGRNSSNINGAASDFDIDYSGARILFIYVDGTTGWSTYPLS